MRCVARDSLEIEEDARLPTRADFLLVKDIADLVDKGFVRKVDVLDIGELFEQFALFLGEGFWRDERDGREKVALTAAAEVGDAVALDAKDRAGLCARGDL